MNILFGLKVTILLLIEWLYGSPILLTIEPRLVNSEHVSLQHMSCGL